MLAKAGSIIGYFLVVLGVGFLIRDARLGSAAIGADSDKKLAHRLADPGSEKRH